MWPAPFRLIRLVAYSVFLIACTTYSSDLLPHGWSTHYSNGVAYYYNQKTGVTQWEKPVVSSQSRPLPQQTRPLQAQNMRPAQSVSSNPHQQHKLHHTAQQNRQEDAITSRTSHGPNVPNDFTKDIVSSPSLRSRNDSTSARGGNLTRPESTAVLSDVQQFISKLRDADKKIDDLNLVIDDLEEEKAQLLLRKQLNDDAMANLTSAADVLKLAALEEYSVIHSALLAQITTLESSVDKRSQELENLRSSNSDLERNIVSVRETINVTTSTISEFLSNITTGESRLKSNRDKLTQQDRELADEYKNIGQLEEDMRNVAGPSLKRLRQPSFFGRVLESAFPVWAGGKGSLKSSRRAKGREAAALAAVEAAKELNATVEHIRNNLTVMAATIASREVAIEELSEQLEERIDEASKRRDAYAALKDGVNNLNEENERLLSDLEVKDGRVSELVVDLHDAAFVRDRICEVIIGEEIKIFIASHVMTSLGTSNSIALKMVEEDLLAAEGDYIRIETLAIDLSLSLEKALQIEEKLTIDVCNMTARLSELHMRRQMAAEKVVEDSLLPGNERPWFWFLWPF